MTSHSLPAAGRLLIAAALASGCATFSGTRAPNVPAEPQPAELHGQRLMLSEGYSILYHDAEILGRLKGLIYAKEESDDFERVIRNVAAFGERLRADLERIDRDYPGVRVDLDPLPELEKRKRLATALDKVKEFAPVVGTSGPVYERTVLISIANGINQERHLVREIAKEEPDAGLKAFLAGIGEQMDRRYEEAESLLEKTYFRHFPGG